MAGMTGLMRLVANEGPLHNAVFRGQNLPPPETQIYKEIPLEQNNVIHLTYKSTVPRLGDMFRPKSLIFDCEDPLQPIHVKRVCIEIGGVSHMNVPFSIFKALSKESTAGSKKVFTLDFTMFIKDVRLICLAFHDVRFVVYMESFNNIRGVSICCLYRHLDTEPRRQMAHQQMYYDSYQYFQTINCVNQQQLTEYSVNASLFDGISKGYVFEGPIDTLEEITLYINGQEDYKLNQASLPVFSRRISENLVYIPFNQDYPLETNSFEAYQGAFNHNRVDSARIKIKLSQQTNETFKIHSLCLDRTFYATGMAGPAGTPTLEQTYDVSQNVTIVHPVSGTIWSTQNKVINPEKALCPIEHDDITEGMEYCECSRCNNCYKKTALFTHFHTMPTSKKCPMCREPWSNWVIYTNSAPV